MTANNRTGSHNRSTLLSMLSERDKQILQFVRDHKFVTTRQLQRLLFHAHATIDAGTRACNRVLQRLRARRFLYRLDRQIGGIRGGSGAYVWELDVAGDRVTRPSATGAEEKRIRAFEPTPPFLAHTLAITEARVRLEETARTGAFELVDVSTEPSNWRTYVGPGGTAAFLKPDLYVVTAIGEYEDHWFLEIDQGTESLPTLLRKCRTYMQYRSSGIEQTQSGVFPLVVWIIEDERRRDRLLAEITRDHRLDSRLFYAVSAEQLPTLLAAPKTDQPLT